MPSSCSNTNPSRTSSFSWGSDIDDLDTEDENALLEMNLTMIGGSSCVMERGDALTRSTSCDSIRSFSSSASSGGSAVRTLDFIRRESLSSATSPSSGSHRRTRSLSATSRSSVSTASRSTPTTSKRQSPPLSPRSIMAYKNHARQAYREETMLEGMSQNDIDQFKARAREAYQAEMEEERAQRRESSCVTMSEKDIEEYKRRARAAYEKEIQEERENSSGRHGGPAGMSTEEVLAYKARAREAYAQEMVEEGFSSSMSSSCSSISSTCSAETALSDGKSFATSTSTPISFDATIPIKKWTNIHLSAILKILKQGLAIRTRTWRLSSFKRCFVACDMVSLLEEQCKTPSRKEATEIGEALRQMRVIESARSKEREKPFLDKYTFFRFRTRKRAKSGSSSRKRLISAEAPVINHDTPASPKDSPMSARTRGHTDGDVPSHSMSIQRDVFRDGAKDVDGTSTNDDQDTDDNGAFDVFHCDDDNTPSKSKKHKTRRRSKSTHRKRHSIKHSRNRNSERRMHDTSSPTESVN